MELLETNKPAKKVLIGSQGNIILSGGKHFKIETGPGGEEILNATVPEGKIWEIFMSVGIEEKEA